MALWKPGDVNTAGGVITATDAIFRNNRRSVEFISYQNSIPNSNTKIGNFSSFVRTTFEVNDDYLSNDFAYHVSLWDVNGIGFTGCSFNNNQTNKTFTSATSHLNKGIYSIDAGYNINPYCSVLVSYPNTCPTAYKTPTSFTGFGLAVNGANSGNGSINTINIDQSLFADNIIGVEMSNMLNFTTTRSNFILGDIDYTAMTFKQGIHTLKSTGYRIEENTLSLNSNAQNNVSIGIYIRNSGTNANQVYKNSLDNMWIGQIAQGLNRNPNLASQGFQFLCNNHSNSISGDIYVLKDSEYNANDHGIRVYQGDFNPIRSAGNTFTTGVTNFSNQTDWPIIYYHNGGATEPVNYYSQSSFNPIYTSNANNCPTKFAIDKYAQHPLEPSIKGGIKNDFENAEAAYINVLYSYNQLIDGGSTPNILLDIQETWSQDA